MCRRKNEGVSVCVRLVGDVMLDVNKRPWFGCLGIFAQAVVALFSRRRASFSQRITG